MSILNDDDFHFGLPARQRQREPAFTFADFVEFHRLNPNVYQVFKTEALRWRSSFPDSQCSVWLLGQRVRWVLNVETVRPVGSSFKISNGCFAYYARLLMRRNPTLRGMFNIRPLKDGEPDWVQIGGAD